MFVRRARPRSAPAVAAVIEAAGLDNAASVEILSEGAAGSRITRFKLPAMLKREFEPPQFQARGEGGAACGVVAAEVAVACGRRTGSPPKAATGPQPTALRASAPPHAPSPHP